MSMLLDFDITYVRNTASQPAMWSADMEYLRSRISTNRSAISDRLTLDDGRLYEGAKTLVDLLDYFHLVKTNFILNEVQVEISKDTAFPRALLTANLRAVDEGETYGPITVTCIYTNVGQRTNLGGYIVTVKAATGASIPYLGGLGNMTIRDLFGNVPVLEKYVNLDRPWCYRAGQILRYSENFPTPSEYVNDIEMLLTEAIEAIKNAQPGRTEE